MTTDKAITEAATAIGRPYGMTPEQVLLYAVTGDVPHPDAPADVCGATDPRDNGRDHEPWCHLPSNHGGEEHNRYGHLFLEEKR